MVLGALPPLPQLSLSTILSSLVIVPTYSLPRYLHHYLVTFIEHLLQTSISSKCCAYELTQSS
jgi:hypothetical protein